MKCAGKKKKDQTNTNITSLLPPPTLSFFAMLCLLSTPLVLSVLLFLSALLFLSSVTVNLKLFGLLEELRLQKQQQ